MTIFCDRSHRPPGWSNFGTDSLNEWWVCGACGKPTKEWLLGSGNAVLNYFRSGPLDGQAYETTTLLSTSAVELPTDQYKWTPEIITSDVTGKSARVWVHMTPDELASRGKKMTEKTTGARDKAAGTTTLPPVPPTDDAGTTAAASTSGAKSGATDKPAAEKKQPSTAPSSIKGETITSRRKALKFGREDLSARAGISVSQLWRFENDKPLKAGTEAAVIKALEEAEAEKAKDDAAKAEQASSAAAETTAQAETPAEATSAGNPA